jgi:hypothetical protein
MCITVQLNRQFDLGGIKINDVRVDPVLSPEFATE